jgi:hypothetical protein
MDFPLYIDTLEHPYLGDSLPKNSETLNPYERCVLCPCFRNSEILTVTILALDDELRS